MLVPSLAAIYVAPGATGIDKAMAVALFDAANHYLGMGVGEHLGYFFTAIWTVLVSALIFKTNRIVATAGVVIAVGVISGMLEPFGVPMTGMINSISYTLWAVWTLILSVVVLRGKRPGVEAVALPA
jgi:hypothetical protein